IESAVDIGMEVRVRLLNRRDDVGARRKVKYVVGSRASPAHGAFVGDISFDDPHAGVAFVPAKITAAPDHEAVEHTDRPALGDEAIDQMASDEACPSRDDVESHPLPRTAPSRRLANKPPRSTGCVDAEVLGLSPNLTGIQR